MAEISMHSTATETHNGPLDSCRLCNSGAVPTPERGECRCPCHRTFINGILAPHVGPCSCTVMSAEAVDVLNDVRDGDLTRMHALMDADPTPERGDVDRFGDVIAEHGDYRVNDDGWTVCLCGHVAVGDDDDGSHARHVASMLAPLLAADRAATAERTLDALIDQMCDCGDFDGHPGDCAATPIINLRAVVEGETRP